MKKIGDLLGAGLFLIAIYILLSIFNPTSSFLIVIGIFSGIIGSIILIISQGYYLINKWFKR